jgi:hypothetical protein
MIAELQFAHRCDLIHVAMLGDERVSDYDRYVQRFLLSLPVRRRANGIRLPNAHYLHRPAAR